MKSIVVNKIIIVTGFLVITALLEAQKPGIDLISSYQQNRHPEAIIDTGIAVNATTREPVEVVVPPVRNHQKDGKYDKKRRRQLGPSLDSIFQKEESRDVGKEKKPVKISLFNRKHIPLKILIYITAIK
jgi:hypothetical protein